MTLESRLNEKMKQLSAALIDEIRTMSDIDALRKKLTHFRQTRWNADRAELLDALPGLLDEVERLRKLANVKKSENNRN